MDPNRMAGMMALGDAFGALRSIGKGPFQANATMRGMQLVQAAQEKKEREAQQKAALTNMGVIPSGGFGALSGPLSAPQALAQAGMYGEAIQAQMQPGADPYKGIYKVGNDIVQVDPRAGNSRVIHEGPEAAANWETRSVNGALVRVNPDTGQTETLMEAPAPGSGFRLASPEEAAQYGAQAGQFDTETGRFYPINAPRGMVMEADGQGGFVLRQGAGVGNGLTQANNTEVQRREIDMRDQLGRLTNIEENLADPEFLESLTAAGALKRFGLEWADFINPESLTPDQQRYLTNVTMARGDVLENLNYTIKAITGAAMTEAEAKRIGATLPGVNDSPTVFQAKLERSLSRTRMAIARYNMWRNQGMPGNPQDLDTLGNIERKVEARRNQLVRAVQAGEMTQEQAHAEFSREFGI